TPDRGLTWARALHSFAQLKAESPKPAIVRGAYRLPAVYPYRFFTVSGGLVAYGVDPPDFYRRAASYVDLILKGAKPWDLPVQYPTKFEFVINRKTANELGLVVPWALLIAATELID